MNIIIKIYLSSKYTIKIFDDTILVWYRTRVTLYFMRKIIFSFLVISLISGTAFAAAIDGECSNLDTFYTSNPRNSSLSGKDLCDEGAEGTVSYSSSREQWTYKCLGKNGGSSNSCIVDLKEDEKNSCRIEVTDKSGVVPFSTSISCSGKPSGKIAIVVSQNGKILDAIDSADESYDFDDAGVYTFSCYPDVVNDR